MKREGRKWRSSLTFNESGSLLKELSSVEDQSTNSTYIQALVVGCNLRPGIKTKGENLVPDDCVLMLESSCRLFAWEHFKAKTQKEITVSPSALLGPHRQCCFLVVLAEFATR